LNGVPVDSGCTGKAKNAGNYNIREVAEFYGAGAEFFSQSSGKVLEKPGSSGGQFGPGRSLFRVLQKYLTNDIFA